MCALFISAEGVGAFGIGALLVNCANGVKTSAKEFGEWNFYIYRQLLRSGRLRRRMGGLISFIHMYLYKVGKWTSRSYTY